jgi:hypothetical protein
MSNLDAKATIPALIWWGQIVDDSVWKVNSLPSKWKGTNNIPGWGSRYKVRILGRDTETKDVPDDQLEWAECAFPVTAGSGHAGSYQTSNLRKGAFVFGFYKDGINMSEPFILGCLANNDQTRLSQTMPLKGFIPFSGYVKEMVSVNDIPGEGSAVPPSGTNPRESGTGTGTQETTFSDQVEKDDGNKETYLTVPTDCDKLQLGAIQVEIKKLIQNIQEFKKRANSWKYTILKPINEEGKEYSIDEYIRYKVENVAKWISGKVKIIITNVQQFTTNTINNAAKDFYYVLFPNQRPGLKKTVETANDLLACLFRKIIANLLKMVTDFLLAIVERFINAPLCAIENIIGALLGKLTGLITSAVDAILAPLKAILGVFDIAGGIIDFVVDLLSFLSCEENPECPGVTGWTPWQGATKFNLGSNVTNLIDKVKQFASDVQQSIDPDNFNFDLDFSDIFQDTCNVGPIFCGPPIVEFYGGGGSGATGNAIVSAAGDILGVDMTGLGLGYTSAPIVKFVDGCGRGQGAVGRAIINSSGQVENVIMNNPGFGYLPSSNGDLGGDGRTWATSDQTIVKRKDGTYDRPYDPGETIKVDPGDEVSSNGKKDIIKESKLMTAPPPTAPTTPPTAPTTLPTPEKNPPVSDGKYLVRLDLDSIVIDNPGINYGQNDKIKITPDYGSIAKPRFDSLGSLISVDVIKPGIGFSEVPIIEIETETGYNASLLPVFKVNKVGDGVIGDIPQSQIISVVDCVGKF